MKRIDTSSRAVALFGPGKDGFKDGDLANGIVPTDFNAAWPNGVQEEIMAVVEAAGLVPSGDVFTQLLQAIRILGREGGAPGTVFYTARPAPPPGSIKANAAAVSRTVYANLFAAIGTIYGAGDGSTTFNVPDVRADFIRGLDDGRGIDLGRVLGTLQMGTMVGGYDDNLENGNISFLSGKGMGNNYGADSCVGHPGGFGRYLTSTSESIPAAGDAFFGVTRPRNIALLACIQY